MYIKINPCQDCTYRLWELEVYDKTDNIRFRHLVRTHSLLIAFTTLIQVLNQLMGVKVNKYVIEGTTYTDYLTACNILEFI